MGNTAPTGHVLAIAGVGTVGFEKTLQEVLRMHHIQPWSAKELLQEKLQRQLALAQASPLRCIPVAEGLSHYSKHVGTWLCSLTREKFVQASMELFHAKGLRCPLEEQKMLYDVFDSIDLYQNATLSIGELSGGLSNFFAGDLSERTAAIFDALAPTHEIGHYGQPHVRLTERCLTKDTLQSFLKPYVWCMVPLGAEVLRPLLLEHVAKELFFDIACDSIARTATSISLQQMQHWMRNACRAVAHEAQAQANGPAFRPADHASNAIVAQVAVIIDTAMRRAWSEHSATMELRAYGQQSWAANHGTRQQYLMDVGAAQWASQKLRGSSTVPRSASSSQPTLLTSAPQQSLAKLRENIEDIISSYWGEDEEEEQEEPRQRLALVQP